MAGRGCFLIVIFATARARRVSVSDENLDTEAQEQEMLSLDSLTQKQGAGHNFTVSMSIAGGNSIGQLNVQFQRGGTQVTNQGFSNEAASSEYWRAGSILGKDDDYVWEIQSDTVGGTSASFTFDHGVSDLVFGDLLVEHDEEFFRMEFEETAYQKVQPQSAWLFQQPVEDAVGQHLREEIRESRLRVGDWHPDGYFKSRRDRAMMSYTPRLMAKKSIWEDAGGKFKKVVMQRPAIMDIDLLFGEEEMPLTRTVRKSVDVVRDRKYKGNPGNFPSLGTCKDSDSVWDQAHKAAGYFCGRSRSEQCTTQDECDKLGGRWKEKYCMAAKKGSPGQEATCGCCKDIGRDEPGRSGGPMTVQLHVQWYAPVVTRFQCAPVEAKWSKSGASSVFVGMGWGTEGDVEGLDIDLSLVPLDKNKKYIKDKLVFFNAQTPPRLQCNKGGQYGYAMQAFADDRSGDSPGDDELVKINLKCLSEQHPDIETVVVLASIYRPQRLTWNMLDSVYMRLVSGGHEEQRGSAFLVHDADSLRSFVRLSGDAQKANPVMESTSLAVGMLFKEASGEWAFAGLMEGLKGNTAMHVQKPLEKFMKTLNYPISQDWDAEIDDEEDMARTEPCVETIS